MLNIVVLESEAVGKDISWDGLKEFGNVTCYAVTDQGQIAERIKDADIVCLNKCELKESNLKDAHNLKLICESATGFNNIDVDYCHDNGIVVTNVKGYSTDSVAQHTFAMLFYVYEKLTYYDGFVKSGRYASHNQFTHLDVPFHELAGKRWGIVGLGNIGRKVAEIATAFGCEVVYYSASGRSYDVPYKQVEFDELIESSQIISVHCPLTEKTNNLFTYREFERMKDSAVLLNVARGPVVNNVDLAKALEENLIAGAGIDVFEKEPIAADNPLWKIQDSTRLVVTPHIAWGTVEARTRLVGEVLENIRAFLRGESRNRV